MTQEPIAVDLTYVTTASLLEVAQSIVEAQVRSDRTVEIATDVGRLLAYQDDGVMTPFMIENGTWEPAEGKFLRRAIKPGNTVLDVGANVGYFTLLAAQAVGPEGQVIAVEPEIENLALLRSNIWLQGLNNVKVIPAAAGRKRDLLRLTKNSDNRGDHQIESPELDGPTYYVPVIKLDELTAGSNVDVIKIDTQGIDHDVIEGLLDTLKWNPDVLVLTEFWTEGLEARELKPEEVLAQYRNWGLEVALLNEDGEHSPAKDHEVLAAVESWPGRFVNLVLSVSPGTTE